MQLGQLARDRRLAIAERRLGGGEEGGQPAGRLEKTSARGSRASAASRCARGPGRVGRNPSKTNRSAGRPATDTNAVTADGPGIGTTGTPAASAPRTRW